MKRILLSIGWLAGGGAERVVSVWASQLAEIGYEVAIFTYAFKDNEYQVSDKVERLTVADTLEGYLSLSYYQRYKTMRRRIKDYSPDVVISFLQEVQIWMAMATFGLKIKRIETVRNSPWHDRMSKKVEFLWNQCFKSGYRTILQSEDQKPYFGKKVQKKCYVVPNPLDEVYEKSGKDIYSVKAIKFAAAGRLVNQKNYPLMINAFAKAKEKCPDITLDIFGKGDDEYTEKLQTLINELNMQHCIRLCGRTNDMHSELMKRDAFIMSSDYEGMPNALAEAMATGLVCISTDCKTGPRDLIKIGENGFLVPVGDVDALAERIIYVANLRSEEIERIGRSARLFVTDYCGRENSLKKLIKVIEE